MPLIRDKILLDDYDFSGDCAKKAGKENALRFAYQGAGMLAEEMEERGLLNHPDALVFLTRQEEQCKYLRKINAAHETELEDCLQIERKLVDDIRVWLDTNPKPVVP